MRRMTEIMMVMSIGLLIGACAPTQLGENWGASYQAMRAKQVLNPNVGEQLDPVEGQDGKASATAMDVYRKTFEKPEADFGRSIVTSGVQTK